MDLVQVGKLTEEEARQYIEGLRWPNGPVCPHCKSQEHTRITGESARAGLIQCNACRQQYTVTLGTVLEDTHLPLQKWVLAFHLFCSSKKGISALQLQRQLGLGSYRTAWHLAHRIRHAMKDWPAGPTLSGKVEVDETYVGGKPRRGDGKKHKPGRGTSKAPVVALVEREGRIRVKHVAGVTGKNLKAAIRENVQAETTIYTDDFSAYDGLEREFAAHQMIAHSRGHYAIGDVHINTAESFFSLLKRGIIGSFHHVSKKHLHRYCDEFGFRWDHRKTDDGERRDAAIKKVDGKRLSLRPPKAG